MLAADERPVSSPVVTLGERGKINSRDLFGQLREIEIEHGGRIYRLRLTQLNKLILTASPIEKDSSVHL